jgi:hypothetical protein
MSALFPIIFTSCKERGECNLYFEYLLKEKPQCVLQSERALLDYGISLQGTYNSLHVPTHFFLNEDRLEETLCMILL